jgi:3-hydroxyisobutyrate dehydrogenase-like beta-hydroxyacid dehydrogenase
MTQGGLARAGQSRTTPITTPAPEEEKRMSTAIIGVGTIGSTVAKHLVDGGEQVVLAAHTEAKADALAERLGERASAASVPDAIAQSEAIVFAVWLDPMKELIQTHAGLLDGKVVIDPSNPMTSESVGRAGAAFQQPPLAAGHRGGCRPAARHTGRAAAQAAAARG